MIVAVIVAYYPDLDRLRQLVDSIVPQVGYTLIVDNGSAQSFAEWVVSIQDERIEAISLGTNKGIAAAHNIGIEKARTLGASHVLLLDQDSIPNAGMVVKLVDAIKKQEALGYKVAAAGPYHQDDRREERSPFIRINGLHYERLAGDSSAIVAVDYLISSGCLIPLRVFDSVGAMREDLFIDYVDVEWGVRAKSMGYQSFGVFGAIMEHSLGDSHLLVFGKKFTMHNPLRHYYMFRNAVWLYHQSYVSWNWKVVDGFRFLLRFLAYSALATPRREHLTNMLTGVFHGIRGRLGQKDTTHRS